MATTWLGSSEAAATLGITPRTLYRLIDDGKVRAYRLGRVIRLRSDDINDFLEASQIEPGTRTHLHESRPDATRLAAGLPEGPPTGAGSE